MSSVMRHLTGGWRRPRSVILAAAIAAFSAGGLVAWAAWSSQGNGPGAAKSLSMPGGNTPTASVSGTAVTVGWAESDFANGTAVHGYRIQRYEQGGTTTITPGIGCGGTITALTCTENAVPAGTGQYTVTPIQGNWIGAESQKSQPVTVSTGGPTATATSVHSSGTPSVFGQSVTFTATVTPAPPANETITFMDGSTPLGSGPLDASGSATLVTASLSVATHTISASYAGDSNFAASSGSTVQVVNKASTSVAVTSSDSSAVFGESLSFTTTVTAVAPGAGTPDGTVQFQVDAVNLGAAITLTGGTATSVATTTLSVGSHTVTAVYSGSTNFTGATGTLSQTVGKAATSTVVTASSTNPSVFGQAVTFTATVNAMPPGAGTSTGSVQFFAGAANLGAPVALSSGVATSPAISSLPIGNTAISASYLGDGNFTGSASPSVTQTVNKDATTTVVTSSANPSVFGQSVTFTATVSANAPGAGTPTGTVSFSDGANSLGRSTLSGGSATLTTTTLSVGNHSITASYGGDGNFVSSASSALQQVGNQAATA